MNKRLMGPGVLAVAALLLTASARAEDPKTVRKIELMNRVAMEDADILDFQAAKKGLEGALALAKESKLDRHAVAAQTHLNLGIVYGTGLAAPEPAVTAFKTALEIDPAVALPAAQQQKADLVKLFDQAKAALAPKKAEPAPEETGPVRGIRHVPVDAAKEGQSIPIEAKVGDDVHAKTVNLFFRAQGTKDFVQVPMKPAGAQTFRAEIPANLTTADSLHYYIDARNQRMKVVASKGNASAPFVISVSHPRKEVEEDKTLDDENLLK